MHFFRKSVSTFYLFLVVSPYILAIVIGMEDKNIRYFHSIRQQEALERLRDTHRLQFIVLHGSHVTNRARKNSDIDVALVEKFSMEGARLSFDSLLQISNELETIFGQSLKGDIDIKTLRGVDPLFRYLVVRDGQLLAGDPGAYNEFKAFAFRDYMDSWDLRKLERQMIECKQRSLRERYAKW